MSEGVSIAALVNFAILVAGLIFFLRKPIGTLLHDRHHEIKTNVDESERQRAEATNLLEEQKKRLAALEEETQKILAQARQDGEKEKKAIIERAHRLAEKMVEDTQKETAREKERAKQEIQYEVVSQATNEARALLKEQAGAKEHERFTEQLIAKIEEGDENTR